MTREQHLLLKLAEECNEVAHMVSKYIQFGGDEAQSGHANNRTRLRNEMMDLICVCAMVIDDGLVDKVEANELRQWHEYKKAKIAKYLKLSQELGYVEGDRIA